MLLREENTGKTNDKNPYERTPPEKIRFSHQLHQYLCLLAGKFSFTCYAIPKYDKDFIPPENPSCDSEPARRTQSVGSRPHTDAATHKYSRMKNLSGICKCLGSLALRAGTR